MLELMLPSKYKLSKTGVTVLDFEACLYRILSGFRTLELALRSMLKRRNDDLFNRFLRSVIP